MRAVVQRVSESHVVVDGHCVGRIGYGFLVLVGVQRGDTDADMKYVAEKLLHLRIVEDAAGKMNRSLLDAGGCMLLISQFTLLGDCRRGRRPSFVEAELPDPARGRFDDLCEHIRGRGVHVETGIFGADMQVHLVNDGPVTILLDSRERGL